MFSWATCLLYVTRNNYCSVILVGNTYNVLFLKIHIIRICNYLGISLGLSWNYLGIIFGIPHEITKFLQRIYSIQKQ
ncbi:hypothetical protein C2G38_2076181 [Gigaspora rosea]|uniref:Uncharacterized protein n=1 Tax=Gigaspora rosea TaxID=44941 RepID=A0A397VIC1_9GLOM|nr:hypothetical protein C2G38_2076181 [Gigaspora rosea]